MHEQMCHPAFLWDDLCLIVAEPGWSIWKGTALYVRVRVGADGTGDEIGERNGPHEITAVFMKF